MPGMVVRLEELTSPQLAALDRARTVVFLPVSPVEQHGPHAPLGTDVMIASYFAERLAQRLVEEREGWNAVLAPALPIGCFTLTGPGSIQVRQATMRALLVDYLTSLTRSGFQFMVVVSYHGGPCHTVALEEACEIVSRKRKVRAISAASGILFSFLTGAFAERISKVLGRSLTREEQEAVRSDLHAGMWETSMLLKMRPEMVQEGYRFLDPVVFGDVRKLRPDSAITVGNGLGYLGAPALADRVFADASAQVLEEVVMDIIGRSIEGKADSSEVHSPFYYIPLYRTHALRNLLLGSGLVIVAIIVLFLIR